MIKEDKSYFDSCVQAQYFALTFVQDSREVDILVSSFWAFIVLKKAIETIMKSTEQQLADLFEMCAFDGGSQEDDEDIDSVVGEIIS